MLNVSNFETNFLKNNTKLHTKLPCQKPVLRQTEWGVQHGMLQGTDFPQAQQKYTPLKKQTRTPPLVLELFTPPLCSRTF